MDTKCYVEGCKSGREPCKETLYFFKPKDKNTVELWEKCIGRKDLKLDTMHLVCHKHFEEANIIKVPVQQQNQTGQANDKPPLPEKTCVKLAAGAVPTLLTGKIVTKVYPSKIVLASLPPAVSLPQEVGKSVQRELPQTLFLRPVPRERVINSKDAVIRPIVINKSFNLCQSNAVQMLQKVSPTVQQITTQQPLTNCQNALNQQTPPVCPNFQRIQKNTAQELGKVSSAPRHYLLNPKEATLPFSWFWQEGSPKEKEIICSKFKWLDENKFEYTKTVIINGDTRTLRYFLRGQEILNVTPTPFSTVNQLIDRLRIYDQIPECVGYPEPKSHQNSPSLNLQAEESGETRSKNCLLLGSKKSNSCRKCIGDATRFKENVPRQTSNRTKKSSNTQTMCQATSLESPVTHFNVDENLEESDEILVLTDHSSGAMTSQPARDKRTLDRIVESHNGEIYQVERLTVQNRTKKSNGTQLKDDENDECDLELAKLFLKKELTRKKTLRRQLHRDLVNHKRHKEMARSVLKAAEKLKKIMAEKAKRPRVKYARPLMPCEKCGRMVGVARMKLHLKIHDGYRPHVCEICGRGFANKSSLKSHSRFNHLGVPKTFMCSTCGHMCVNKRTLEIHEMTHTDARPFSCSICDKTYRSKADLKVHKRSHTGEKPYTCTVCAKSYSHRHSLKKHFRRHHENMGPDGNIDPHIGYTRRKNGTCEKRYSCTICGKAYTQKKSLIQHVKRYHDNGGTPRRIIVPRYRCEFCQKKFCRVLAFERHRATHTGAFVGVPCGQLDCDFTYSNLKELKEHLVARHPEKVFHCELCDKVFLTQLNLSLHQTVHNPAQGFQCTSCPLRTPTMQALLRHEKIHMRERNQE